VRVVIETDRLILRPPLLDDLDRWAEMMSDEEAVRYIGGVQGKSMVWRSIMVVAGSWALTGVAMFSVVEKSSGRWVGRVGPWQPLGWPGTEVGWALHPDAWGRGYALEAAIAAMDYAFDTLAWTDVVHCISHGNERSRRLAERLGSTSRGMATLPPPHHQEPLALWGQTRQEWRSRPRPSGSSLT
jgi:RimJ/RimL family protein N-acetyltransferase